ncbi:MAG: zinc dependent phospholipase C family protein [Bacteroidota bacterium]
MKKFFLPFCFLICFICSWEASAWGFFAHKRINRLAVFTLPAEMLPFYKYHIAYLTENAVNPDRRRYAVEGEAPRHYIDADMYGDSALYKLPRYWKDAVAKYTEDTLMAYGIVPWHIQLMKFELTEAFRQMDAGRILRLSADLGHYIGDANVPLHTTSNYNGQFTGQQGIHGFWESRLPELFSNDYDFFVGQASYLDSPQRIAWQAVINANAALDSVLRFDRELTEQFSEDKKYGFEERNGLTVRVYSREFSQAYSQMLSGQVERQMRASIQMVGNFWYTCWVDAGQPDLSRLIAFQFSKEEQEEMEKEEEEWKKRQPEKQPAIRLHEVSVNCLDGCHNSKKNSGYSPWLAEAVRHRYAQKVAKLSMGWGFIPK